MFYTIYKITNVIDGKIYVGKHQTNDLNDGYMGSGKRLKHAIKKHGIENFRKDILFCFHTESEMNSKEAEIVTEEFCLREDTYNLCVGGNGGFSYINRNMSPDVRASRGKKSMVLLKQRFVTDDEFRESCVASATQHLIIAREKFREKYPNGAFIGRTHTHETKMKMSKPKNVGSKNSQYGTIWITNGSRNAKVDKDELIPEGWRVGRIVKPR